MGRSSDRQWLKEAGAASEHRRGPKGHATVIMGTEFGKRDPPSVVTLTHSRHYSRLTLGGVYTMSRPTTSRPRAEQREGAAREDRVDLALQGTPRAIVGGRRGVFSCGFPRLV